MIKNISFIFFFLINTAVFSQIQQNIIKNSGTESKPISEIDSIRFDVNLNKMEIVLNNGNIDDHNLPDINYINFSGELVGEIASLNCNDANINGTLYAGVPANDITLEIPYTGGNGGTFASQAVNSMGVTGLTAILDAGNFAEGDGTLNFTISGIPESESNGFIGFYFPINIGEQSCIIYFYVSPNPYIDLYPSNSVFCQSWPTPINEAINPITGKTWMDRNLGANQVAISTSDELAYGDLYQWGRNSDGHQCRDSNTTATLSSLEQPGHPDFITGGYWLNPNNFDLWQDANGINNPCPEGYRIPTIAEWDNERLSWSSNDALGAFNSPNKFVMAGLRRHDTGEIQGNILSQNVIDRGEYWSSTIGLNDGPYPNGPYSLVFHQGYVSTSGYVEPDSYTSTPSWTANGKSVRCIKDITSFPGTIESIDCESAEYHGFLIKNFSSNPNENFTEIFYTGGNGGFYDTTSYDSTGVLGLTATINAGEFNMGDGSLIVNISGGPNSSGEAVFSINIGGQSCNLIWNVLDNQNYLWPNQFPNTSVFCDKGKPTEIVEVYNPITNKIWMDRNLGAQNIADSKTDSSSFGDLYQWGRLGDGHQCRVSKTSVELSSSNIPGNNDFIINDSSPWDWRIPQNNNLWQGVNGTNNPCPIGFRLPTEVEFLNEKNTSWTEFNDDGAFNSVLRLTNAGRRYYNSSTIAGETSYGRYWTSTIDGVNSKYLSFNQYGASIGSLPRLYGYSVRCIKDQLDTQISSLDCDNIVIGENIYSGLSINDITCEIPYSGGDGTNYNAQVINSSGITGLTLSLTSGIFTQGSGVLNYFISGVPLGSGVAIFNISIGGQSCSINVDVLPTPCLSFGTSTVEVLNPTTGRTWMDRNLGAYGVANSMIDGQAVGNLYQWGRYSDDHQCRTSPNTDIVSSTDEVGHGAFITPPSGGDWRSPQNDNLWQGVNSINNPCPDGFRIPTEVEWDNERLSWTSNNSLGAFNSILKLPNTGWRKFQDGNIQFLDQGFYWTSTIASDKSVLFNFYDSSTSFYDYPRAQGSAVRCIKN